MNDAVEKNALPMRDVEHAWGYFNSQKELQITFDRHWAEMNAAWEIEPFVVTITKANPQK